MPSSRAISAIGRPLVRTSSTASRLNSGVNCRLLLRCCSGIWTASSHRRCPATGGKSKDEDRPHRRGLRLSRVPHPAAPKARHGQAPRLHLPRQEGVGGGEGEAPGAVPAGQKPATRRPTAPAQPGAARMDQLLQARGVQGDLQLPTRLRLAAGGLLAAPQASPSELEVAPAALRSWVTWLTWTRKREGT